MNSPGLESLGIAIYTPPEQQGEQRDSAATPVGRLTDLWPLPEPVRLPEIPLF